MGLRPSSSLEVSKACHKATSSWTWFAHLGKIQIFASQNTNPRPIMYKLPPLTPGYDFIVYDFIVGFGICFL